MVKCPISLSLFVLKACLLGTLLWTCPNSAQAAAEPSLEQLVKAYFGNPDSLFFKEAKERERLVEILSGEGGGYNLFELDRDLIDRYGESRQRLVHLLPYLSVNIHRYGRANDWVWQCTFTHNEPYIIGPRGWSGNCAMFNRIFAFIANEIFFYGLESLRVDVVRISANHNFRGLDPKVQQEELSFNERGQLNQKTVNSPTCTIMYPYNLQDGLITTNPVVPLAIDYRPTSEAEDLQLTSITGDIGAMVWPVHMVARLTGGSDDAPVYFDVTRGTSEQRLALEVLDYFEMFFDDQNMKKVYSPWDVKAAWARSFLYRDAKIFGLREGDNEQGQHVRALFRELDEERIKDTQYSSKDVSGASTRFAIENFREEAFDIGANNFWEASFLATRPCVSGTRNPEQSRCTQLKTLLVSSIVLVLAFGYPVFWSAENLGFGCSKP